MNKKGYRRQGKFSIFDKGLVSVKEERKRRKMEESKCNAVQLRDKKKEIDKFRKVDSLRMKTVH